MPTRVEFEFHTRATPEEVVEVLTDFSADRPKRWLSLSERWYEVYDVGVAEADVREGQDRPRLTATASPDGGSDVHGTWERGTKTLKARAILMAMSLVGRKVLSSYFCKVYDDLAEQRRH